MLKLLFGSRRTRLLAALACVLGSMTVYANIGLLAASAWLISAAALHPSVAELSVAIVGVRFFGLARAVARYAERYTSHDATFRLLADIRVWLYARLEPLVPARIANLDKGDLFTRMLADVETLKFYYLRAVFPVVIALLVTLATGAFLAWLTPWLVWPVIVAYFVTGCVLPVVISRISQEAGKQVINARSRLHGVLADSIDGVTELAAFCQAETQTKKVLLENERLMINQEKANRLTVAADALGVLGMNLTVIGVIILAVPLVNGGQLDGVYLAVVALAVQAGFEAILPLPAVAYYLRESAAAMARITAITAQAPSDNDKEGKPIPDGALQLVADKLSFSYASHLPPAVSDITFCLPPGKRLAIVGASGAGKSTLVGLLLRFWDCKEGMLRLNGCDIREYSPENVRKIFSVVSQDTYLFNASIGDNILLAKPYADPSELEDAIKAAMLGEFVARLPQGLATRTGQNGLAISGGERQRIALARALLKNAPIWLLDEPTAGLDAQTEMQVMEHILQVAGQRSLILITHRLVGLENMDEILVLKDGKVVERGTAEALIAGQGIFYRMWTLQRDLLNIT